MRISVKFGSSLGIAVAIATLSALASPVLTASASTPDSESVRAWSCSNGSVCVYSRSNGRGTKCQWNVKDPNWAGGNIQCSFSVPRSVWNRKSSSVKLYGRTNYRTKIFTIAADDRTNVNGGSGRFAIRSHKW
ncbi:peptidase inhibitor family I36 protein [Streptomyces anulatus]|uniref:peptidase inhibitor family I36 protein n=1 Tax=Streptomyces anulatus TaxID=1892 RepID=UPI003B968529